MRIISSFIIYILALSFIVAQVDYSAGFKLLEEGKFSEAESFFKPYYLDTPEEKTVLICYGRALGLSSDPDGAVQIFKSGLDRYEDDLEINLNLAEAYMWSKNTSLAIVLYRKLVDQNKANFTARLGYANALNENGQAEQALSQVNIALGIEKDNPSALNSKKYILLALVERFKMDGNINAASAYIDTLSYIFGDDDPILISKASLELMKDNPRIAKRFYKKISDANRLESLKGISYAQSLQGRNWKAVKQAYRLFNDSIYNQNLNPDYNIFLINNLASAGKLRDALDWYDGLDGDSFSDNKLDYVMPRLNVWEGYYEEGLSEYEELDSVHNMTYVSLMGQMEAYWAQKKYKKAISILDEASFVFPNKNFEIKRVEDKINNQRAAYLNTVGKYSWDIADDASYTTLLHYGFKKSKLLEPFIHAKYRYLINSVDRFTDLFSANTGSLIRFGNVVAMQLSGGISISQFTIDSADNEYLFNYEFGFHVTPNKYNKFIALANNGFQDYNFSLVNRALVMNNYSLTYSFNKKRYPGVYLNMMRSVQSDRNIRDLFYGSIYYTAMYNPEIKFGINANLFGFRFDQSNAYFSPSAYFLTEIFFQIRNIDNHRAKFLFHVMLASGRQTIDDEDRQNTYRLDTRLGYRISEHFDVLLSYEYSNSAQTTAAGFSFSQVGISVLSKMY